jgi:hypothetical protein
MTFFGLFIPQKHLFSLPFLKCRPLFYFYETVSPLQVAIKMQMNAVVEKPVASVMMPKLVAL